MTDWTNQTLKEYFEKLLEEIDKRYDQRFKDAQSAVQIAFEANNKRLDGMNEFRKTIEDQQDTLMPRKEALGLIDSMKETISGLGTARDEARGKSVGIGQSWGVIVGVAGILSGILLGLFLKYG